MHRSIFKKRSKTPNHIIPKSKNTRPPTHRQDLFHPFYTHSKLANIQYVFTRASEQRLNFILQRNPNCSAQFRAVPIRHIGPLRTKLDSFVTSFSALNSSQSEQDGGQMIGHTRSDFTNSNEIFAVLLITTLYHRHWSPRRIKNILKNVQILSQGDSISGSPCTLDVPYAFGNQTT